jgi:hypothetical protein
MTNKQASNPKQIPMHQCPKHPPLRVPRFAVGASSFELVCDLMPEI